MLVGEAEQRNFPMHLSGCFLGAPWYVTSRDKKTLPEFAGGDLLLSSSLAVCPLLLPSPSFSVHWCNWWHQLWVKGPSASAFK